MNREIKFRAWDKKKNIMREAAEIKFDGVYYQVRIIEPTEHAPRNWSLRMFDEISLMQFTGLLDKNGKEIYEGDVVSYYQPYAKRTDTHIVKWDSKWAAFGLFENSNEWCRESDWVKIQDIEIIGNIYENPELLNSQT